LKCGEFGQVPFHMFRLHPTAELSSSGLHEYCITCILTSCQQHYQNRLDSHVWALAFFRSFSHTSLFNSYNSSLLKSDVLVYTYPPPQIIVQIALFPSSPRTNILLSNYYSFVTCPTHFRLLILIHLTRSACHIMYVIQNYTCILLFTAPCPAEPESYSSKAFSQTCLLL
jgi:hypothetical protein